MSPSVHQKYETDDGVGGYRYQRIGRRAAALAMLAEKGYRVLAKNDAWRSHSVCHERRHGPRRRPHGASERHRHCVRRACLAATTGFRNSGCAWKARPIIFRRGNFDLHVDKFWIDYHENGSVKSYNSTLTVLEQRSRRWPPRPSPSMIHSSIKASGFISPVMATPGTKSKIARVNIKDKEHRQGGQDG